MTGYQFPTAVPSEDADHWDIALIGFQITAPFNQATFPPAAPKLALEDPGPAGTLKFDAMLACEPFGPRAIFPPMEPCGTAVMASVGDWLQ